MQSERSSAAGQANMYLSILWILLYLPLYLSLSFSLSDATALHEWSCWQMILLQVLEIINKQVIIDTFKPHVANMGGGDKVSEVEYNMKPL